MKKLLLASVAVAALSSGADAAERFPNWYVGLSAGLTHQNDSDTSAPGGDLEWDTGSVYTASLGYQPPSFGGFRTEAEYSWRKQDSGQAGGGDAKVNTGALNAYYDFVNGSTLTPYVGAGLGYAKFDIDGGATDGDDNKWIYQLMAGVGYEAPSIPNVQWTLGYRYFAPFDDVEANGGVDYEYDNHSVEVGAKFRF